jgi:glycosidase
MKISLSYEFHISRQSRAHYAFDDSLFATDGRVIVANISAARHLAQQINARRDLSRTPDQAVRAGEINALGLIDEVLHHMLSEYKQLHNPNVLAQALDWLDQNLGGQATDSTLERFLDEFPPQTVYHRQVTPREYLELSSTGSDGQPLPNRQVALEEMLMLWLANANPATLPYQELIDDSQLRRSTLYPQIIDELHQFFSFQPALGVESTNFIDFLRSPALAVPGSLTGQLEFIRTKWGDNIRAFVSRLLVSLDIIHEETRPYFPPGPGPSLVPDFTQAEYTTPASPGYKEFEAFSQDLDWMPRVVMLAKNSYVWLDQLSKKYGTSITHLDQVPDAELDTLEHWGITGLWLIGIWERSPASERIKKMRGNPEAVASAYSLYYYDIARDLGGESAFQDLRQRAWARGIRMGSDMVPNHMGIDSRWVIEHPDWFVSLPESPFPTYTFNGPDLSWDERVGIFIEDHYYNNTDAAVVFKRLDRWTGSTHYIYHGNDGTSMPWNDTAQLNYLIPEVREAVIQTILHVARKFPIIRFDAAMTLAKRHYHRLWFPAPGAGGDIPSRAGLGLTQEDFDAVFPEEFWRQVVDRVAQEVPDTLLLAEAFWLMEGYFVRTLGMHRVYNSAFMNMMRDEKNQEYRSVIKNTMEFDPEILKRYVNFMNNPDERTAVDQFGKGDKYFGVCTLLATLPGLPMLGHAQIEGFTEKYGMEYRKAYWDEQADPYLLDRHEKEVFPLLRKRALFAEAVDFRLFDFFNAEGAVDEDVFAYTNRRGANHSLVIYHNRYKSTRGWLNASSAFPRKTGDERQLIQENLAFCLGIPERPDAYMIMKEHNSGQEFLFPCLEIHRQGLYLELNAYQCLVYLEFKVAYDTPETPFALLNQFLGRKSVPDVHEALLELQYQEVLSPFRDLVNAGSFGWLIQNRWNDRGGKAAQTIKALAEAGQKLLQFYEAATSWINKNLPTSGKLVSAETVKQAAGEVVQDLEWLLAMPSLSVNLPPTRSRLLRQALDKLQVGPTGKTDLLKGSPVTWSVLLAFSIVRSLGFLEGDERAPVRSQAYLGQWMLDTQIQRTVTHQGLDAWTAQRSARLVRLLLDWQSWFIPGVPALEQATRFLRNISRDLDTQHFLNVNLYDEKLWFNKENYDEMTWWLLALVSLEARKVKVNERADYIAEAYAVIEQLLEAEARSGFELEKLA